MSTLRRGTRNVFRNPIRTMAVVAILGISLGMVVVMLAARSAVNTRISEVKKNIGNTVTIAPAGARGFLGGGEALTTANLATVSGIAHVTSVNATIDAQLSSTDTTLKSGIEAGTLGGRGFRVFGSTRTQNGTSSQPPADFTPPIFAIGTNNATYGGQNIGSSITISSGQAIDATGTANEAVVGKAIAEKNSLTVGSTFTAYSTKISVVGIYDAGNTFSNNSVIFPLATLQKISSQTDQVTALVANVDSVDNLATTTNAISSALGTKADVTSSEDSVKESIKPLENIRTITATSLVGALVAASVITLLTMVMVVRERRKEIAILKSIGASDTSVMAQFMTESVVVSLFGSVIGLVLGFVLSNPILKALLTSSEGTATTIGGPVEGGPRVARIAVGGFRAAQSAVRDLQAVVDWHLIVYGLGAALLVAIIGSAIPVWMIGRVRPAEVLRGE